MVTRNTAGDYNGLEMSLISGDARKNATDVWRIVRHNRLSLRNAKV